MPAGEESIHKQTGTFPRAGDTPQIWAKLEERCLPRGSEGGQELCEQFWL